MASVETRDLAGRAATRRFLLLVLVLLASCTALISRTVLTVDAAVALPRCVRSSGVDPDAPAWWVGLAVRFHRDVVGCRSDAAETAVYIALLYTAAVVATALTLYWWLPRWKRRGGRLPEVPGTDGTAVRRRMPDGVHRPEGRPARPGPAGRVRRTGPGRGPTAVSRTPSRRTWPCWCAGPVSSAPRTSSSAPGRSPPVPWSSAAPSGTPSACTRDCWCAGRRTRAGSRPWCCTNWPTSAIATWTWPTSPWRSGGSSWSWC